MPKPTFSLKEALSIAKSQYNITGSIKELPSYEDQNFCIESNQGKKFVLKIANSDEKKEILELQNDTITHLSQFSNVKVPIIHKDFDKSKISTFTDDKGIKYFIRLVSYIPGTVYANVKEKDPELLEKIGKELGIFTKNLTTFSHPTAQREFKWNLLHTSNLIKQKIQFIKDKKNKNIVKKFKKLFESQVLPELDDLRSSVIHNDWNDYNIIINKKSDLNEVEVGIIDFGDVNYGKTIFELTIALTYLMMDEKDPLLSAFHVVKGFNEYFPLTDLELKVIFPLIGARLCMSVCNSAHLGNLDPNNEYIKISEKPAWKLLEKLQKYPKEFAYQTFYQACHHGYSKEKILELRKQYIGPNLSISYEKPLKIIRGFMQYLYDDEGKCYLDCVNNIPHVGHSNPEILEVINRQASVLNTNTRYLHDLLGEYAKRLCETFPDPLTVCYFVNSGSEANELALRLVYNYTKQRDLIVIEGGYHGNTESLIGISSYKFDGKGGSGSPAYVHKVPVPDTYRGKFKSNDPQAGEKYAKFVKETVRDLSNEGKGIVGFISESIMGSGGQIIYPENYLKSVYEVIRNNGGLCIADEVQVGFGRVGTHFWGFETQKVIPDIVTVGKPMANGHPMGAVITTKKIANAFNNGMEWFSSFGGNPVSCAIGLKVLEIIEIQKLQQNALIIGTFLLKEIRKLMKEFHVIGDVRGVGLFMGIELVRDRSTLTPAKDLTKKFVEKMKEKGILVSADGVFNNVIKIKPPLIFNMKNAEKLLVAIKETFLFILNDSRNEKNLIT